MPFERPVKQTTGRVSNKKEIMCSQKDPFNIFMNDMPISLFFLLHILSFFTRLCLSYLPRLGINSLSFHSSPLRPQTCPILCLLPCVLITKALRSGNSMSSIECPMFKSSELYTLHHISLLLLFTPLMLPTCYGNTLEDCCQLSLTEKRGEE